jgi:ferredoxin-type protein NapH
MNKRFFLILGLLITAIGLGSITEEIHGCFLVPVDGVLYFMGLTSGQAFGFLNEIEWYLIAVGGLITVASLLTKPDVLKRWSSPRLSKRKMGTWRARRTTAHLVVYGLITLHIALTVLGITSFKGVCPRTLGEYIMKGQLGVSAFFWAAMLAGVFIWGRGLCGWLCVYAPVQEQAANLLKVFGMDPRKKPRPAVNGTTIVNVTTTLLWGSYLYYLVRNYQHIDVNIAHGDSVSSFYVFWVGAITMLPITMLAVYYLGSRWFCKYLCPIGGFLGLYSKYSLVQVRLDRSKCVDCGACSKQCQMSVDIGAHIKRNDDAIANRECIGCGDCIDSCPKHALGFGMRSFEWAKKRRLPVLDGELVRVHSAMVESRVRLLNQPRIGSLIPPHVEPMVLPRAHTPHPTQSQQSAP